jgi:hypothetical protein
VRGSGIIVIDASTGTITHSGVILLLHGTVPYRITGVTLLGIVLVTLRICWLRSAHKSLYEKASGEVPHDFVTRESAMMTVLDDDRAEANAGRPTTSRSDGYTSRAGTRGFGYTYILLGDDACDKYFEMSKSAWAPLSAVVSNPSRGSHDTSILQLVIFD